MQHGVNGIALHSDRASRHIERSLICEGSNIRHYSESVTYCRADTASAALMLESVISQLVSTVDSTAAAMLAAADEDDMPMVGGGADTLTSRVCSNCR